VISRAKEDSLNTAKEAARAAAEAKHKTDADEKARLAAEAKAKQDSIQAANDQARLREASEASSRKAQDSLERAKY